MKLRSVLLVYVFGVLELAGTVSSLCLVRNTPKPNVYLYQCFRSTDYVADVRGAPIDVPRVTFVNSKIAVVKNDSFTRLGNYLERLGIFHCGVEEIEANAFRGLKKLEVLALVRNKLRVIKGAWFEGLSSLKTVSFHGNEIKHVDANLFSILPPLELLDISLNEITCLPAASFGNFQTNEFTFRNNRLTPMCQASVLDWLKNRNIETDPIELDYFDAYYDVTNLCVEELPTSYHNEETLNKCIDKTSRKLLPGNGNYTVQQVCELLNDTPSPFLNCTGV